MSSADDEVQRGSSEAEELRLEELRKLVAQKEIEARFLREQLNELEALAQPARQFIEDLDSNFKEAEEKKARKKARNELIESIFAGVGNIVGYILIWSVILFGIPLWIMESCS